MKYSLTQILNSSEQVQLEMIIVSENDLTAKELVQLLNSEHVSILSKSHILGIIEEMMDLTRDGELDYTDYIEEFKTLLAKSKWGKETDEFRKD